MKTNFLILIACFLAFTSTAQTTPTSMKKNLSEQQNPLWDKVSEFENQSLPASALEVVDQIYQKALTQGDSPQLIKALIYRLKFKTAINSDDLPVMIQEIEKYTAKDNNKVEQALLYSVLAELYSSYYSANSYGLNRRTAIEGYVPEDIKEWPGNVFIQKIADNVKLSLLPKTELQKTNALDYKDILTEGESSRNLRPTLYDFLSYRGIELLNNLAQDYQTQNYFSQTKLSGKDYFSSVGEFINLRIVADDYDFVPQVLKLYQELLGFRMKDNNPQALLIADLDRLEFVSNNNQSEESGGFYMEALNLLEKQYENKDFSVEVLYREAAYYLNKSWEGEVDVRGIPVGNETNDNVRKAYEISQKGINKYPSYERISLLKNLLSQMTQADLQVESQNAVYPGKDLELNVNHRNFNKLVVEIYKINVPVTVYTNAWSRQEQYKKSGTLIEKKEFDLINDFPYARHDTLIKIPMKELGNYEYVVYADKMENDPANQHFSVTRLATVSRSFDNKREFLVVDRLTGNPLEGAELNYYVRETNSRLKPKPEKSYKTDKLGLTFGDTDKDVVAYNASYKNDTALVTSSVPWVSTYTENNRDSQNLSLFTDRSIYRPGQTVYFKGIAYITGKTSQMVVNNKTYSIVLRDANNKEIVNKSFTTNEFGSFAGDFVLPQGLLNGNFSIQSDENGGYVTFKVEEYKRPTFDIHFKDFDKTYNFGDKVVISGDAKTFSGINLRNSDVKYRITRQTHWMFRMWRPPVQIAQGNVKTDDDGNFELSFIAEKAFEDRNRENTSYTYIIEASVTDTKGETQSSQTTVHIGDKSMSLSISGLNTPVDKDKPEEVKIQAMNLSGKPISTTGNYEIYSLNVKDKGKLDTEDDDWTVNKLVHSGSFKSDEALDVSYLKTLSSGKYRIIAKANDDKGRETENEQDFILTSVKDKRPPVPVHQWLMTPKTECKVGETAEIIYGTSMKDVNVLYEIFQGNKKLTASRFKLNNENRKIEIPFLESYEDGIVICLTFVKEGELYTQNVSVLRKQPDKKLIVNTEVFRDRLTPGGDEEWKVSVKDADKNPVFAELMATMYDASLDKIYPHSWYFNPTPNSYLFSPYFSRGNEFNTSSSSLMGIIKTQDVPSFNFDQFNWFGWNIYDSMLTRSDVRIRGAKSKVKFEEDACPAMTGGLAMGISLQENMVESADLELSEQGTASPQSSPDNASQLRQNFNERAFFYPQLKTNEEGETLISFIVPESNTTWKFMGLAHTEDLRYGQVMKEAISQKKLMVTPNIPRFLREGDEVSISANISNLSMWEIKGTVSIGFFDPATNRPTISVPRDSRHFTLDAGKTITVTWTFQVPAGLDLTGLRIKAVSPDFSDGEQHLVPVLPNRMLVTESLPLSVSGEQTRTFTLDKMQKNKSTTLENYRLSLEFSNNPTWYAVQALPALYNPQSDNIVSWFGAYFSSTLANHIANTTPKVKQMIESWTATLPEATNETLFSALEKNQDMKAVLLEETPWVLEAENETEQKQKLQLLFDINQSAYFSSQAIDKIKSFQLSDGGWSWFNGMSSNTSLTQWILYGMGELAYLKAVEYKDDVKEMQNQAVGFIDGNFKKHYDDYKKYNPDGKKQTSGLSTYELEYLLVRSLYKDVALQEAKEAADFYLSLLETNWAKNTRLYDRAISAIILHRNGKEQTAKAILKSLREHATRKQDMGMYWANNNTSAFMFQSATCIHTFVMEAFQEIGTDSKEMDDMKLWLLRQKQTQVWESVPATVSSVYILLKTGSNWLDSAGNTRILLGETRVNPSRAEAGTGYFKQVFSAKEITSDMSEVTILKKDSGPAWGALYWQYFENLDKISQSKGVLNVSKELFIENVSSAGKKLIPISSTNPLKVGDKVIVRLTIRSDRDMEYVMLKDMRAGCFEPVEQLSGTRWAQGLVYYQTTKDASTNFYMQSLPKGTYVFEYPLYVTSTGDYSNGITTIQCMYAPEFVSHTSGGRVTVE